MNATLELSKREWRRFTRQKSRWIGALLTPLLFWLLIGGGIGAAFVDPSGQSGSGYLRFFFPGILALSVLFTAIFSTMSVIEDRHEGFLQGVLVSPAPRWVFLLAKVLSGAGLGMLQAGLLMGLAPFVGIQLSFLSVLGVLAILFVTAAALTSLGFMLAWRIDSTAGYHSMMNVLLMPMWILSGSVFPMEGRGWFLELIRKLNPLAYSMESLRALLFDGTDPRFWVHLVLLTALSLVLSSLVAKSLGK